MNYSWNGSASHRTFQFFIENLSRQSKKLHEILQFWRAITALQRSCSVSSLGALPVHQSPFPKYTGQAAVLMHTFPPMRERNTVNYGKCSEVKESSLCVYLLGLDIYHLTQSLFPLDGGKNAWRNGNVEEKWAWILSAYSAAAVSLCRKWSRATRPSKNEQESHWSMRNQWAEKEATRSCSVTAIGCVRQLT